MNRAVDILFALGPAIGIVMAGLRWLDAFRLSSQVELPAPLPVRVLLARYNLLVVTTYIYRAYLAAKKPASGD